MSSDYEEIIKLKLVVDGSDVRRSVVDETRKANRESREASKERDGGSSDGYEDRQERNGKSDDRHREKRKQAEEERQDDNRPEQKSSPRYSAKSPRQGTPSPTQEESSAKRSAYGIGSILRTVGHITGIPSLNRIGYAVHDASRFANLAKNFGLGGVKSVVGGSPNGGGNFTNPAYANAGTWQAMQGAAGGGAGGGPGGVGLAGGAGMGGLGNIAGIVKGAAVVGLVIEGIRLTINNIKEMGKRFSEALGGAVNSVLKGNVSTGLHAGVSAAQGLGHVVGGPLFGSFLDKAVGSLHTFIDELDQSAASLSQYNGAIAVGQAKLEIAQTLYNVKLGKALQPALVAWDTLKVSMLHGMEKLLPAINKIADAFGSLIGPIASFIEWINRKDDQTGGRISGAVIGGGTGFLGGGIAGFLGGGPLGAISGAVIGTATGAGIGTAVGTGKSNSGTSGLGGGMIAAHRASGGMIFQPKGTDVIPAMLSRGEFVVNAKSTSKFLPQLESINNMSEGGVVDHRWFHQQGEDVPREKWLDPDFKKNYYQSHPELINPDTKNIRPDNPSKTTSQSTYSSKSTPMGGKAVPILHAPPPNHIPMPNIQQNVNFDLQMAIQHERAVEDAIYQIRDHLLNGIATTREEVYLLGNMINASTQVALGQM